ncbi:ArsR/SmtB family transcription factor [Gulosibacter macacae]|uniref:ArsR/SmtB family transcription factor n=1 Tax=Gulosibacter macacae TaxID=2488791 RepID=UPI00163A0746|nr:metalloregulator ArsR/SmtB family transcription factor [Gulosibacter macacae]
MNGAEPNTLAYEFRVLADPTRLRILDLCREPATVSSLVDQLGLAQSTVSHHVKVLLDAGFVSSERSGTWSHYCAEPARLRELAAMISPDAEAANEEGARS